MENKYGYQDHWNTHIWVLVQKKLWLAWDDLKCILDVLRGFLMVTVVDAEAMNILKMHLVAESFKCERGRREH